MLSFFPISGKLSNCQDINILILTEFWHRAVFSTYNDRSQPLGIKLRSCLGVACLVYPAFFFFGWHVAKRATAFLSWSFYVSTQGKLSQLRQDNASRFLLLKSFIFSCLHSFVPAFIHLCVRSFIRLFQLYELNSFPCTALKSKSIWLLLQGIQLHLRTSWWRALCTRRLGS